MNKKVDEEYEGIKDVYILQCICSELKSQLQQKENIIKEVREETIKYKEIMENGIEKGAYYSYLGSLQQKLDKFLEILDKGE